MIAASQRTQPLRSVEQNDLFALLVRVYRNAAMWRQRQITVRELRALDDRMLRDIGIKRSEIYAIACQLQRGP